MFRKNVVWLVFVSILMLIFVFINFALVSYILILTLAFRFMGGGFFSFTKLILGTQISIDKFHYRNG